MPEPTLCSIARLCSQRGRESDSDGRRATLAYDPAGRRVLVADSTGRTTTVYDSAGQTVAVAQPQGKRVTYAFDATGRRRTLRDPDGGRTTYTHDPAGQLTALTSPQNGRTTFAYDAAGREVVKALGNGTRVTQSYDTTGRVTGVHTGGPAGLVRRLTYTLDPLGRRANLAASDGNRTTYIYDATGQLVRERRSPAGVDVTHTYDPAGNRGVQVDSGVRTTYTYDPANELTRELTNGNRTTYVYDAAGNRARADAPGATTYYTWDARGHLSVAEPVGGPVTFTYDGTGRRATKVSGADTTRYVWDFKKLLQEADGSGTTENQYLSTEGEYGDLVSAYGSGGTSYFGFDALGSTEVLLDDTGSVTARLAYRAFGLTEESGAGSNPGLALPAPLPAELGGGTSPGTGEPFAWVGRENYFRDTETGLYLLGAGGGTGSGSDGRYYDPATARFLTKDPIEEQGGSPNFYLYCANDPVNKTDPSGNLILTPSCEIYKKDSQIDPESTYTADILSNEINQAYAQNKPGKTVSLTSGKGIEKNERSYRIVNLFDNLPAETWGTIRKQHSDNSLAKDLAYWLIRSLSDDLVIRSGGPLRGNEKSLIWGTVPPPPPPAPPPDRASQIVGFAYNNTSLRELGHLGISETHVQMGARAVAGEQNWQTFNVVANTAVDVAGWAGAKVKEGYDFIIEKAEKAVILGFAAILREVAKEIPGINPDAIFKAIEQFKAQLASMATLATKIVDNGPELLKNFFNGAKEGSENFFNKLSKHFKGGLLKWLNLPKELADFNPQGSGWKEYGYLLLKIVGYTWDDLIGLVVEAVGADNLDLALDLFDAILPAATSKTGKELTLEDVKGNADATDVQPDLYKWLKDKLNFSLSDEDLVDFKAGLLEQIKNAALSIGAEALKALAAKLALAVLPGGGIITLAKTLYDTVSWLLLPETGKEFGSLINTVQILFKDAIEGKNKSQISKSTEELWSASIVPIVSGAAALAKLGKVPTRIRYYLQKAKGTAQKPVKALLNKAAAPIQKVSALTTNFVNETTVATDSKPAKPRTKPLVAPVPFGEDKKRKLWLDQNGNVWVRHNPDELGDNFAKKRSDKNKGLPSKIKLVLDRIADDFRKLQTGSKKTQGAGKNKTVAAAAAALKDREVLAKTVEDGSKAFADLTPPCVKPESWGDDYAEEYDCEFLMELRIFRGNDDTSAPKGFRGREGQLFLSDLHKDQALKRWLAKAAASFEGSVQALRDADKAIRSDENLAKLIDVVKVYKQGGDWIQRGFDPDSITLKDAIKNDEKVKAVMDLTLQSLGALRTGTHSVIIKQIISRFRKQSPKGPSENLHWSTTQKKILIIDLE